MQTLGNSVQLAAYLGVSEAAVRKHVRKGLYRQTRANLFDLEMCKQAWECNRDPDAVERGLAGKRVISKTPVPDSLAGENSLTRARTISQTIKAQREALHLEREQGEVIRTADAYAACRTVIAVVNERLDGAAAQIGARVVGLNAVDAERVAKDILAGVRKEIAGMSGVIEVVAANAK